MLIKKKAEFLMIHPQRMKLGDMLRVEPGNLQFYETSQVNIMQLILR